MPQEEEGAKDTQQPTLHAESDTGAEKPDRGAKPDPDVEPPMYAQVQHMRPDSNVEPPAYDIVREAEDPPREAKHTAKQSVPE